MEYGGMENGNQTSVLAGNLFHVGTVSSPSYQECENLDLQKTR